MACASAFFSFFFSLRCPCVFVFFSTVHFPLSAVSACRLHIYFVIHKYINRIYILHHIVAVSMSMSMYVCLLPHSNTRALSAWANVSQDWRALSEHMNEKRREFYRFLCVSVDVKVCACVRAIATCMYEMMLLLVGKYYLQTIQMCIYVYLHASKALALYIICLYVLLLVRYSYIFLQF